MTPREELGAAIEKYLTGQAAENGDAVVVSGWVLCYETSTYSDGDPAWAIDYTCGEPGTLAGAVGIVSVGAAKIMRDTVPIRVTSEDE